MAPHRSSIARCIVFVALLGPACGGKVVVDGDPNGSGGGGAAGPGSTGPGTGSSSAISTGPSTTTGVGGAGGSSATTLNPKDKAENIVLLNGNLSATSTPGSVNDSVRATTSKQTGKWYFEVYVDSSSQSYFSLGLADQDASLEVGPGTDSSGCGYTANGDIACNGSFYTGAPPYSGGDIIGIAADMDADLVYFHNNGGWIAGNPELGDGLELGSPPMFPMVNLSEKDLVTVNFGAPFFFDVPGGYNAGW